MGVKKFIQSIQKAFGVEVSQKEGKKAKLKELISQLKEKRKVIKETMAKKQNITAQKSLQEEYDIITLQIKKSRKILKKLLKED